MKQLLLTMAAAALMCSQSATAQNRVKNISADTQTLKVEQVMNREQPVQLSRYFMAGYNTLCLPMSLNSQQIETAAEGLRVERLEAIRQEGNTLSLYFVDCTNEGIEAGMPYLIFSPKAQSMRIMNKDAVVLRDDIKVVRMNDNEGNQVSFSSSWTSRTKEGLYGIPAQQNVAILESILIKTTAKHSILPTRCGFSWDHQAATATTLEIKHVSASEATAIRTTMTNDNVGGDVYNLSGYHLTPSAKKGLYIQNGKKVFGK